MKIITIYEYDELKALQSSVMIERWDSVMSTGKGKRELRNKFNEEEIRTIKQYYKIFYKWYRITGIPHEHKITTKDYIFLKYRVIPFFASF